MFVCCLFSALSIGARIPRSIALNMSAQVVCWRKANANTISNDKHSLDKPLSFRLQTTFRPLILRNCIYTWLGRLLLNILLNFTGGLFIWPPGYPPMFWQFSKCVLYMSPENWRISSHLKLTDWKKHLKKVRISFFLQREHKWTLSELRLSFGARLI